MWQWVPRGNIQQNGYIPQTEQHSPFGLMLLHLGNVTIICKVFGYFLGNTYTSDRCGLSLSKQHAADWLLLIGTQQDLSLSTICQTV